MDQETGLRYAAGSIERLLLENDPRALGTVIRWIAEVLTWPRFWSLRADAQDLHQEVLLRVVASLREGRFDPAKDFRVYVQAIARYTAQRERSIRLDRARRSRGDSTGAVSREDAAEIGVLSRQLTRRILETLGDPCRDLLISYYIEERGYMDIAASLEVPVGTVKSRLSRCLESARRAMRRAMGRVPRNISFTRDLR